MLDQQTGTLKSGMMKAGQQRSDGKDGGYHRGYGGYGIGLGIASGLALGGAYGYAARRHGQT